MPNFLERLRKRKREVLRGSINFVLSEIRAYKYMRIISIYTEPTKEQIAQTVALDHVIFHNIKWDTDGQKTELPKAVAAPKELFEEDYDFSLEGADFLSDNFGWCVKSFSFDK